MLVTQSLFLYLLIAIFSASGFGTNVTTLYRYLHSFNQCYYQQSAFITREWQHTRKAHAELGSSCPNCCKIHIPELGNIRLNKFDQRSEKSQLAFTCYNGRLAQNLWIKQFLLVVYRSSGWLPSQESRFYFTWAQHGFCLHPFPSQIIFNVSNSYCLV